MANKKVLPPTQIALHLLDQANKIFALERLNTQMNTSIADLVNGVNKVTAELARKIEAIERRVIDLERSAVKEPTVSGLFSVKKAEEDEFN